MPSAEAEAEARATPPEPSIVAELRDDRESRGAGFVPFHFREAAANLLTLDEIDPDGKIPEFKFCAVRVAKSAVQPDSA